MVAEKILGQELPCSLRGTREEFEALYRVVCVAQSAGVSFSSTEAKVIRDIQTRVKSWILEV